MPDPFAEHVAQPTPAPNPSTPEAAPLDPLDTIGIPDPLDTIGIPGELDTPPPTPRPRPTMGRIVLYRMMESDIARMPWGAGNVEPGDTAPAACCGATPARRR